MITIRETADGWVIERDGAPLTIDGAAVWTRYQDAVSVLSILLGQLAAMPAETEGAAASDGLLPEPWRSPADGGVAFSEGTGDGRDFSTCAWTWRDPATAFVPLMLQTSTEYGHMGAELAGFAESLSLTDGRVGAAGRFFDSEAGRQFRDMLLGGRRFTVSVDPGSYTYDDECLSVDDDGWCEAWMTHFLTYEIIGITGTPFAGFATACIELGEAAAVTASGAHACGCDDPAACACDRPTPEASTRRTPDGPIVRHGSREAISRIRQVPITAAATATLDAPLVSLTPERAFFEDPGFIMPTPLTITDQGRVMAHLALRGTCHSGNPFECVTAPEGDDFRDFMCGGSVITAEGDRVETGALTWGIPHADLSLSMIETQAHYALSTAGWADVVAGWDRFGIWVSGALRPDVTADDRRILRALSLSGDWRYSRRVRNLAMCAALAVNYPGFAIIASGGRTIETARQRARTVDGQPMALVASGVVRPGMGDDAVEQRLRQVEAILSAPARAQLRAIARETALERLRG